MINLKIRTSGAERSLRLPVDTQFVPDISEKDSVVTVIEVDTPESLKYLEGHDLNIDEINFLAKRMDSFDKREESQFDAAVSIFRPKTVEALINYTYNLPRFTLISDFSTPNAIGVSHILNRKQVMSLDEMASTDFAKIGKELMASDKGITTPYGVLFVNEDIPFEPVYDGRHFPAFDYNGSNMTVEVSCQGEKEYLYLPCDTTDIDHALTKLPTTDWKDCVCRIESWDLPSELLATYGDAILKSEGIYSLNRVCYTFRNLSADERVSHDRISEAGKAERKFCENATQPKPAPDDNDLITGRFFFPLKITLNPYNEYGNVDWEAAEDLDGRFGECYADEIADRFDGYSEHDECDMIECFNESDSARAKIRSAKWGFESVDSVLYGTVTIELEEQLTEDEADSFKEWIVGQNAEL